MTKDISVDVAIVGAGIAGCHLAQLLAHGGLRVALIDKRELYAAGPDWINAVPFWMFDDAGLKRPEDKELFDVNDRFIIRADNGSARLVINELGVADVHMGLLGARLKKLFLAQEAATFYQCTIRECHYLGERLTEISGELPSNETLTFKAPIFVDASGLKALLRNSHPRSSSLWPTIARVDTCTAAQRTLEIKDRHGATAFLAKEQAKPGDVISNVGFMGGFSLLRTQIDSNLNHVSILCGVRSVPGYPSASRVVNDFVAQHPWMGSAFIDGRGVIPLNAPYPKLTQPGLALLGDAACQVYAAHGSGIGFGLIAANYLAKAILNSADKLKGYEPAFHRRYYHRLYFSEHFRRFSQELSPKAVADLITSGMLGASLARQTLMQSEPTMSWRELNNMVNGARKSPRLFVSMLPTLLRTVVGKTKAKRLGKV